MATRDSFHQAVRIALLKDGWTITHDPLVVQYGGVNLYIDLQAFFHLSVCPIVSHTPPHQCHRL